MTSWQNKHTGEIRSQESSPGDDWIILVPMTATELLSAWVIIFICFGALIWFNGGFAF